MDLAIIFVPFVVFFGLVCVNDPLTRRFIDDWENDYARCHKANRR